MSASDQLLDKFFKGQCSPQEKLQVMAYLNKVDDLPAHLLSKDEWDQTADATIDELKTGEMLHAIKKETFGKVYRLKWIKVASAAAIVAAVLTVGLFNFKRKEAPIGLAKNKPVSIDKTSTINWKSVMNYTEHNQFFTLPDHSTVKIYPGAELRYAVPFVKNKREVYLNGKSFFQVTKDKEHPFVVYAKGISTTALGTSFTITALEKSRFIKVQLHTGKVWVKNVDSVHQISAFSKVLLPGKELVYNKLINTIKVSDSRNLSIKAENALRELNFTQASLVDVFARLEKQYKVKIIYDRSDVAEMSFTGSLKPTQSIASILEEIAELNNLNQIKTAEGYLIRK
ncbi:FecR family protein [Pedobacter sp. MC2016-24]|uniref:FecR family protein n=1 Tax=Pedobacter sp. MC2016-24 TaxID=2780090 RepID=UPI001881E858|nr:FecR family protein [Pedobacter sp. MC2016-24]MBE9600795.1 FecR family protein [Pedobacter sp. MC2016-24]